MTSIDNNKDRNRCVGIYICVCPYVTCCQQAEDGATPAGVQQPSTQETPRWRGRVPAGRLAEAAPSIALQTKMKTPIGDHLLALLARDAPAAMTRSEPAPASCAAGGSVCASSYCTSAKTQGASCKHGNESHAATGRRKLSSKRSTTRPSETWP